MTSTILIGTPDRGLNRYNARLRASEVETRPSVSESISSRMTIVTEMLDAADRQLWDENRRWQTFIQRRLITAFGLVATLAVARRSLKARHSF
jgi:hypothetical protein